MALNIPDDYAEAMVETLRNVRGHIVAYYDLSKALDDKSAENLLSVAQTLRLISEDLTYWERT